MLWVQFITYEEDLSPNFLLLLVSFSISCDIQAACPPALLTHRLMSQQSREEERRRMDEERRRCEEEKLRRQEKRRGGRGGEERPLYESIYSLAGSPGGICPPPSNKSTLDQLHPLQLQVAPLALISLPIFQIFPIFPIFPQ